MVAMMTTVPVSYSRSSEIWFNCCFSVRFKTSASSVIKIPESSGYVISAVVVEEKRNKDTTETVKAICNVRRMFIIGAPILPVAECV